MAEHFHDRGETAGLLEEHMRGIQKAGALSNVNLEAAVGTLQAGLPQQCDRVAPQSMPAMHCCRWTTADGSRPRQSSEVLVVGIGPT